MKKWICLLISVAVIALDQFTKQSAIDNLIPYQSIKILPVLNLTLAFNTGAAFSFLSNAGSWHQLLFTFFGISMSLGLMYWIGISKASEKLQLLALSLILGGAVANLIDRIRYGYVIDFIDFYVKSYHWPIFNIADSAICIGVFLMVLKLSRKQA